MKRRRDDSVLVGIDTGGTFTDLVAIIGDEIRVHKVLSTPADPADAVIRGLHEMLAAARPGSVTYSSTVATNALLEKKGARVALFTNAGFEDLIEIGRQNRNDLYALAPSRPEPLVWRGDLGDEIPDQGFLRQRRKRRHALLQPDRAGVIDLAVDQHHAFLAGVGVDAREPKRKRRIDLAAERAQAVEHGLAMLERDLEAFGARRFAGHVPPPFPSH